MNDYALVRLEDLENNPTARVPVCLCLDTSGSMGGSKIDELNEGIRQFYDAISSDDIAKYSAEICVVSFGGNGVNVELDFANIDRQSVPILDANGGTPMGEAVNKSLDLMEKRKKEYQDKGVDYYQPWLVLMTDGQPNGDYEDLERAISRTADMVNNKKLSVFPIGIGADADMNILSRFSPKRKPLRLKGLNFKEFFEWLSKSVARVSQSTPGDKITLDMDGIKSWGEL